MITIEHAQYPPILLGYLPHASHLTPWYPVCSPVSTIMHTAQEEMAMSWDKGGVVLYTACSNILLILASIPTTNLLPLYLTPDPPPHNTPLAPLHLLVSNYLLHRSHYYYYYYSPAVLRLYRSAASLAARNCTTVLLYCRGRQ